MVWMCGSSNVFSLVKTPDVGGGKVNNTEEGENNPKSKYWVVNGRYTRGGTRSAPPRYRGEIRTNRSSKGNHVASDEKQGGLFYFFLLPRFFYDLFWSVFFSSFWPAFLTQVVKEEKDKKTNETISFELEGELDIQPYVSCGNHYEQRCQDCISSPNRPPATSPVWVIFLATLVALHLTRVSKRVAGQSVGSGPRTSIALSLRACYFATLRSKQMRFRC